MWLHFAYRPLKLIELQHALAVDKGHAEFDSDNIPSQKMLLDCCLGLVIVDEETLTIRFVHFTLEEYFRDNFRTEFPNGYSSIAETCLTYLTFGSLRQHCTNFERLEEMIAKYPFLNYAALYWGTYAKQQQQHSDSLTELIRTLVEHESERPPCAIQALYSEINTSKDWYGKTLAARKFSGIHAIAYFGLLGNLMNFCELELQDDSGRTPLSWAAATGHEATVRLLLERDGVIINSKDIWNEKTPLMWASGSGHEAVVRLLIERDDIEINAKDDLQNTALTLAVGLGHEAVVRLLIERDDVEINAENKLGNTALILAAKSGYEALVRLLIEREDVKINAKDFWGRTALISASCSRHEAVVRLLIERDDIEINARDGHKNGKTALIWAAYYGHEAVVRLLVERDDVEINAKDKDGQTALIWAALYGHEAVVRLLVERDDVEINAKDKNGKTALMWAAEHGREPIVRLIKDRLDVLARGSDIAPGT